MISTRPADIRTVTSNVPVGDVRIACLIEIDAASGAEIVGGKHFMVGDEVVVGRSRRCGLQLRQDAQISRRHCVVSSVAGAWRVRDLDSLHGVRLNGERVVEAALVDGDRIDLGTSTFRFVAGR